jgi:hypothetical protein
LRSTRIISYISWYAAYQQFYIGIHFDALLNFSQHVKNIVNRANKRLNIIKILSSPTWKLNKNTLVNIYKTLMRSILDYSAILILHLSQLQINKLQTVQNKAIKQIYLKKESGKTLDHQLAKLDSINTRFFNLTKKLYN